MNEGEVRVPLVTIACHEDLTASDLVGRYLLDAQGTRWIDGPMTRAVKAGAILYLDEVVEARKDTTVLIHPLTDHRRILPVEKTGNIIEADDRFLLCISYNPHYQSALKDLKHSTRQRFISIEFDYPPIDVETEIVAKESGCNEVQAHALARLGDKIRNPAGTRSCRRRQHPPADLRRKAHEPRHRAPPRLPGCHRLDPLRRTRTTTQYRRGGSFHIRIVVGAKWVTSP